LNCRGLIVILVVIVLGVQTFYFSDAVYIHSNITVKPETRMGHAMAFDPHNDVAVIFGGLSVEGGMHFLGDTWVYSYAENYWTELELTSSPPSDDNTAMVYCDETNEIVFYGGDSNPETWSFACETQIWSRVTTSVNPGFRDSHAMAYDSQENVVILFGGFGGTGLPTDDLWMFNCSSRQWTEIFPSTRPLARYGHVMVYDESINRIVMTGGNSFSEGYQDDTWIYTTSTNDWTELTPIGNPDALKWSSMIYDSVNQRCIMFGGENGADHAVDYTWVYDGSLNTWSRRYPNTAPAGRLNAGLAFDLNNNVIILFGGMFDFENHYDDTWTYSYESNVWTDMEEDSDSTTANHFVFDPMLLALALPIGAIAIAVILILRRKT